MGLQNGAQLILQTEKPLGGFDCVGFTGLHLTYPAVISLCCAGTTTAFADLAVLRTAFLARLQMVHPLVKPVDVPCSGFTHDAAGCYAQEEPHCMKLLILVGDRVQPLTVGPSHRPWIPGTAMHRVLPVFSVTARKGVSKLLPPEFSLPNAIFWSQSIEEVLPSVLALSGLTVENPKIFISYRQADSAALAIQLFDALSYAGFDTFLDHFRIDPGVNFQARLTQQLGDKSMVLLLESERILDSQWTMYEINTAKTCSLGMFALHLPGGKKAPGVDDAVRQTIAASDFTSGSFSVAAELTPEVLVTVVQRVRREHDTALVRRRRILYDSLEGALDIAGVTLQPTLSNGMATVQSKTGIAYVIWLTPRPPELLDFHGIHDHAVVPTRGVVVGLSRLMEPTRLLQTSWLAEIAQLKLVDEGMIHKAAIEIAEGRL